MRSVALSKLNQGINRLQVKGGASPRQLYDLVNGYIDQSGSISPREGTIRNQVLTSATVGLCANNGIFNVFSTTLQSVPSGYLDNLLIHPTNPALGLLKIWFAKPFMGFLYVVAEFTDHSIFHYWLQSGGTWQANTVYKNGNIVTPTTPNGLAFQAQRNLAPNALWSPQTSIVLNQLIEPTEYNGYYFKAIAVSGASPHTGSSEPVWPVVENNTVQEFGDFDTSTNNTGTSQAGSTAQPLGSTITDRYGNSSTISNSGGTSGGSAVVPVANTAVTTWASGTLYAPGAVVRPSTGQGAFINAIPNGDLENGNDGNWILGSGAVVFDSVNQYQGTFCLSLTATNNEQTATMNTFGLVTPGQSVTASCYTNPNNPGSDLSCYIRLRWYNSSDTFLSATTGVFQQGHGYRLTSVTGIAPAGAAHCRVQVAAQNGTSGKTGYFDLISWSLETPAAVSNFLFEAVQAVAGSSAGTEPVWPTIAGNTVIDNTVTWKAIGTSIITWQAIPIMKSGSPEPTWPTTVGLSVHDGTMSWVAVSRQVPTPNPSKAVALAASHVFNGDNDIVDFSAAVDPLDWTSTNNAGYLPTGLNNYGDNPVTMLTLYRSNLMAFNSGGYQMWQVDPDPANMALLDAQPVGSIYPRAAQSVANDLLFLTEVGVRNLGTVGATANMQLGNTGQPVDPLVKAALVAGTYDPISLYYPGRGQYWLIFGPQAFVLTINGPGLRTWSRFVFPDSITDWTLNAGVLYLRTAGNLIWKWDAATLVDDSGGANVVFNGVIQWPYLDLNSFGINKMMIGIDIVGQGIVNLQMAFQENDPTTFSDNSGFATSINVTAPYTVAVGDTLPGEPLPFPINAPSYSPILTFASNQSWNLQALNLYFIDTTGGGALG
jgi:hypothetical protein